jgi:hypothetical protein
MISEFDDFETSETSREKSTVQTATVLKCALLVDWNDRIVRGAMSKMTEVSARMSRVKNSTGILMALEAPMRTGFGFVGSLSSAVIFSVVRLGALRNIIVEFTNILRRARRIMSLSSVFEDCGFTSLV